MDYNVSEYEIVEINDAEWGIQYNAGPLVVGFTTKEKAIEQAVYTVDNSAPFVSAIKEPKNIDEAILFAQEARNTFRKYVGEYPNASAEIKEIKRAEIVAADAYVSEYQTQLETARTQSSDKQSFESIEREQQTANADRLRTTKANEAIAVRAASNATPEQIQAADNAAFEAEVFYNQLAEEPVDVVNPTSFNFSGLLGGVTGSINNLFGQITNPIDQLTNQINSTINNAFGGITNALGGATGAGNTITTGGQSTNNSTVSGTTVYDSSTGGTTSNAKDGRVRISPKASQQAALFSGVLAPLKETGGVVFPYTPTITYQGQAAYEIIDTVHANQNWHVYKNTPSIDLTISGIFTAQNETEAKYYLAAIHFFRALTKMHFGTGEGKNKGLPPPQVLLDGYGTHMFNGLSVILKNYDIQLGNEVDYVSVESSGGVSMVPAVSTISISLTVQQTPAKARTFTWDSFASGELMQQKGWL